MRADAAPGYPAYAAAKARAVGSLRGRVLELGAGEGSNFALLAAGVEWLGLEPRRGARSRLAARARSHGHPAPPLAANAEDLPLPDASVDAVLATVTLCSVADQDRALTEVARVLRPGGRVVLAEHVAAPPGSRRRRVQRLVAPCSRLLAHGCDPARDTEPAVRRSPLRVEAAAHFELPALGSRATMPYVVIEAAR